MATSRDLLNMYTIFIIVIEDQATRHLTKRRGFSQLLGHPGIGWISGDTHLNDAPCAHFDDDEDEDGSEPEVVSLEKVTRPHLTGMVGEERPPGRA